MRCSRRERNRHDRQPGDGDGTTPDPVAGNNSDPADALVTQVADLKIDKHNTTLLSPGQNAVYRLRVDNLGPSDAAPVVRITDNLPAGLTIVSATSVGGSTQSAASSACGTARQRSATRS